MCCQCDRDRYNQSEREARNNERISREQYERDERDSYRRMNSREREMYRAQKAWSASGRTGYENPGE